MNIGPVVSLLSWKDEQEVVNRVNTGLYGLGASVWANDTTHAQAIGRGLDVGNLWINAHMELSPHVPFGGHRQSGLGHEYGCSGLKEYCKIRTTFIK